MTKHYGIFQFKTGLSESEITNCFETMKAMEVKYLGY